MIEVMCGCPAPRNLPESVAGRQFRCPKCAQEFKLACAETLPEGAGLGDFDSLLTVIAGPESVGLRLLLGGVMDLSVGKLPERHISLPGIKVSREHCRLVRIDFGPSRWKIVDNRSTNGSFVNGQRIGEQELQDGDVVSIGEYELRFDHVHASASDDIGVAPGPAKPRGHGPTTTVARTGGPTCPCCGKSLPSAAKICIDCGIQIPSGRPILTTGDVDLNSLYEGARQLIWIVSWIVWVTPLPIPIRSEAFGTRKPYAIWTIAIATILASITFYIAQHTGDDDSPDRPGNNLMLWPPSQQSDADADVISPETVRKFLEKEDSPEQRTLLHIEARDDENKLTDEQAAQRVLSSFVEERMPHGEFHWYQLITCAFLHDTSSILNFLMHLGGNLLFMLVFGTRVNALIGNIATAILYPILAVCAAGVYLLSLGNGPAIPMLGASGAIMGLAGMYLILFPIHRVFCAMWFRLWLHVRVFYGYKIFAMRGFWVLLIYFGYDVLMNILNKYVFQSDTGGGVAHWAHIGGFSAGMILGLLVLASRMFNTHGGDLLSVTMGRYAWPLIGKPSRWNTAAAPIAPPVRATSLNYV
jgi:membrane associated rhomboid family serine protease